MCTHNNQIKHKNKIIAYLGALVWASKTQNVYFDIDTVEAVLDNGCSVTLSTSEQSDFITYKLITWKVHALTVQNIMGIRTVKFTVINDHEKK